MEGNAKMDQKRKQLAERIQARSARLKERTENQNIKHTDNNNCFRTTFTQRKEEIEKRLEEVSNLPESERKQHFDKTFDILQSLKELYSHSTMSLGIHDTQLYKESITKLEEGIIQKSAALIPRKKFAFHSVRQNNSNGATLQLSNRTAPESQPEIKSIPQDTFHRLGRCLEISNAESQEFVKTKSILESEGGNCQLSNLTNCQVYLCGPATTLRCRNILNSTICSGPISGSIFLEACQGCVFYVASRQIRIHETSNCDFYLYVTSRPTIENCSQLRLAPYAFEYPDLDCDMSGLGFTETENKWQQVQDFNWLKNSNSPNWSILSVEQRKRIKKENISENSQIL